jgi:stringent starvation protein B
MTAAPRLSRRPYLLRAMHQWMTDSGFTPHVIVNAEASDAELPRAYARDGKIVLNVSYSATQGLELGNERVEFQARFSGVVQHVGFPVGAVLGIYARETGEGMVFSEQDGSPDPSAPGPGPGAGAGDAPGGPGVPDGGAKKRPRLKVVK